MEDLGFFFDKNKMPLLNEFLEFILTFEGVRLGKDSSTSPDLERKRRVITTVSEAKELFSQGWSIELEFEIPGKMIIKGFDRFFVNFSVVLDEGEEGLPDSSFIYFGFPARYRDLDIGEVSFNRYVKENWVEKIKKRFSPIKIDIVE